MQHAAPATQQLAANALTENDREPNAAMAFRLSNFMFDLSQRVMKRVLKNLMLEQQT